MDNKLEILFELNSRLDGINSAISRLDRAEKSSTRLGRGLQSLGNVAKGFGRVFSRGVLVAGTALFAAGGLFAADSFNKFAQFESSLKGVEAVLKPTTRELGELEKQAKLLGRTTRFTAREAGDTIEVLARNGLKTNQILGGVLEASLSLAASVGAELPAAADTMTDVLQVFNLEAEESRKIIDSINAVTINSKFGFEEYQKALAAGGASAVAVGQSFGEFNEVITATASFFDSGETAGTAYKVFLDHLVPTSSAAELAQKKLGLSVFDAQGNLRDMAVIAEQLRRGLDGLSEEERVESLRDLFGTRGKNFAVALARAGEEGIKSARFLAQFADSARQAEIRLEGTQGTLVKFKSAFEGLSLSIGEPLAEALTPFIESFTVSMSNLTGTVENNQSLFKDFFEGAILNAATFFDLLANIKAEVQAVVGQFRGGLASLRGDEEEAVRIAQENAIRELSRKGEADYTMAAMEIIDRAEDLAAARAVLRDEESKFLDLMKVREQASRSEVTDEEIRAIEQAIRKQDQLIKSQQNRIREIKGQNAEEESEQERSLRKRMELSKETLASLEQLATVEDKLRAERSKYLDLLKVARESDDISDTQAANQQADEVSRLSDEYKNLSRSVDEQIQSDREANESAKISIETFRDLGDEAGLTSDRIITAFESINTKGSLHLDQLNKSLDEVQENLKKTTKEGQDFENESIRNSWLKDFALEGTRLLSSFVANGLSPVAEKISTLSQAGKVAGTMGLSSLASVAMGSSSVSGVAQGLLGERDHLLLKFQEEKALILEETKIAETQRQDLLSSLRARYQEDQRQYREFELQEERRKNQENLQYTSQFFGDLSTLTASKNKKLFKIGQAAAIAEATVRGFLAVQNALATPLPFPIPLGLSAAAATAAAVNVANIASQSPPSFISGGLVGNHLSPQQKKDDTLANVATGEFVMNPKSTAQNLPLLESLNRGLRLDDFVRSPSVESRISASPELSSESVGGPGSPSDLNVNVLFDNDEFMDRMEGRIGEIAVRAFKENSSRFL